jgi:two-component system cell cycle sensor histidine kinase/response regulator CckA
MFHPAVAILVVDDDDDFALVVSDLLRIDLPGVDLVVHHALSVAEAWSHVSTGALDVILLDYRLGPEDGLEFLSAIRSRGVQTPVVVMTGWSGEDVVVRAMKAGATDYVSKSKLHEGRLGAAVRHCIDIQTRDKLHRRAQEEVRASEERFRTVFAEAPIGMMLLDARGHILRANTAVCRMLGASEADLITSEPWERVHPDDVEEAKAFAERLVNGEITSYQREKRYLARDGAVVWTRVTARVVRSPVEPQQLRIAMIENISDRKVAEAALRESASLLEEAQAIAHVGSWWYGVGASKELVWSRETYRIFGIAEGTPVTPDTFFAAIHPDDLDRVHEAVGQALHGTNRMELEHRVLRPDGGLAWVHERGVVERIADGAPTRIIGTVQDITARRAAMAALTASEERYRRIVESTTEGVWTYDPEGVTTFMNVRMAQMLALDPARAVGRSVFEFVDETSATETRQRLTLRGSGDGVRTDLCLRRGDGTLLVVSVQPNPLFGLHGRYEGELATVTDVSSERRADEARARLAAVVQSSEDAILSTDLDGVITSWNPAAEALYRHTAAEVIGRAFTLVVPEGQLRAETQIFQRVAGGETVRSYDTFRRRKDGTVVEVAVAISPIRDSHGAVIGTASVNHDLTSRRQSEQALRRTEEQFRQAQKMEAVGRLAGGIAHDFNNVLSVIISYSELAIGGLKAGDPLRADLEQIHTAGHRASNLTRQLLAFSRQQVLHPRVLDLQEAVTGLTSMLRRLLGEDVDFSAETAGSLDLVLADPGQIEQVIMNLAVNARDAMPGGGTLRLKTSNVEVGPSLAERHGRACGRYVLLEMTDTGTGMDAETQARIFEPFFTTKMQGKGTGLGLSTVFGIVEQSGGFVDVTSALGVGSTFRVYLPRTTQRPEALTTSESHSPRRGTETILLVEDEDQVRAVACAILRRNGYTVLETANGGEAFLLAADYPGPIDLLFTDVVMPRMSGRLLAEQLTVARPTMRVLYASGYTDDAVVRHGVLEEDVAFLQKPFTPNTLLRKVADVLAGPGPRAASSEASGALARR